MQIGWIIMKKLHSCADVIDALGGTVALASELKVSYRSVHNWRGYSGLPSMYYPYMRVRLRGLGLQAPPKLWGVYAPKGFKLDAH
jgi:hypothetical protein